MRRRRSAASIVLVDQLCRPRLTCYVRNVPATFGDDRELAAAVADGLADDVLRALVARGGLLEAEREAAGKLLNAVLDAGVNLIDTAGRRRIPGT